MGRCVSSVIAVAVAGLLGWGQPVVEGNPRVSVETTDGVTLRALQWRHFK